MARLVLKSIHWPTNYRYEIDSLRNYDYGKTGNYLDERLRFYDVMNDGETQHTPSARVLATTENLVDFAAAAARWFSENPTQDEMESFSSVFHYLARGPSQNVIDFAANLKYDPDKPRQYFSTEDTDKRGNPRKSTDSNKKHDKRWTEVHQYNAGNSAATVYRALCDSGEIPQYWDALQRWHAFEVIRDRLRETTGDTQDRTAEHFKLIEENGEVGYALRTLAEIAQAIDLRWKIDRAAKHLQRQATDEPAAA